MGEGFSDGDDVRWPHPQAMTLGGTKNLQKPKKMQTCSKRPRLHLVHKEAENE
jgi:hypothetical protein